MYLIQKGSFWSVPTNTMKGSWIWRKLLKYRELALNFHRVRVGNGQSTSFWFDKWSDLEQLWQLVGARGAIALGVRRDAKISDIPLTRRRKCHRMHVYNSIEDELAKIYSDRRLPHPDIHLWRNRRLPHPDIHLWRNNAGNYRSKFSSKDTWAQLRVHKTVREWSRGLWFKHATPKFAFVTWLALKNRLATGDRMRLWNRGINSTCSLCGDDEDSVAHLFFMCSYSGAVWEALMAGVMESHFTKQWAELVQLLSGNHFDRLTTYLFWYTFQVTVHQIWRERNRRRHGEASISATKLTSIIDLAVRN